MYWYTAPVVVTSKGLWSYHQVATPLSLSPLMMVISPRHLVACRLSAHHGSHDFQQSNECIWNVRNLIEIQVRPRFSLCSHPSAVTTSTLARPPGTALISASAGRRRAEFPCAWKYDVKSRMYLCGVRPVLF